jgi:hypothetical protein
MKNTNTKSSLFEKDSIRSVGSEFESLIILTRSLLLGVVLFLDFFFKAN